MERKCGCGCDRSLVGRRVDCYYFEEACRSSVRRLEEAGIARGRVTLRGRMSLRERMALERDIARRERDAYERGVTDVVMRQQKTAADRLRELVGMIGKDGARRAVEQRRKAA